MLKPGGAFHFLEHGLSPDPALARWQCVLNPLQRLFAGGCRLNVPIADLVRDAGFHIVELHNFRMSGLPPASYVYRGVAISPVEA